MTITFKHDNFIKLNLNRSVNFSRSAGFLSLIFFIASVSFEASAQVLNNGLGAENKIKPVQQNLGDYNQAPPPDPQLTFDRTAARNCGPFNASSGIGRHPTAATLDFGPTQVPASIPAVLLQRVARSFSASILTATSAILCV